MQTVLGTLAPLFSLYAPGGLPGDFGEPAHDFLGLLREYGHKRWVMLPLGPARVDHRLVLYRIAAYMDNPKLLELLETFIFPQPLPHEHLPREESTDVGASRPVSAAGAAQAVSDAFESLIASKEVETAVALEQSRDTSSDDVVPEEYAACDPVSATDEYESGGKDKSEAPEKAPEEESKAIEVTEPEVQRSLSPTPQLHSRISSRAPEYPTPDRIAHRPIGTEKGHKEAGRRYWKAPRTNIITSAVLDFLPEKLDEKAATVNTIDHTIWYDKCPYVACSALALNPLYASLDMLDVKVPRCPADTCPDNEEDLVQLVGSWTYKTRGLGHAFLRDMLPLMDDKDFMIALRSAFFSPNVDFDCPKLWPSFSWSKQGNVGADDFIQFVKLSNSWLTHYCAWETFTDVEAIRMVVKDRNQLYRAGFVHDWQEWPDKLRDASVANLQHCWDNGFQWRVEQPVADVQVQFTLIQAMLFHAYCQWILDLQMRSVREHANEVGIKLIGDLPVYLPTQSADVWANSMVFMLDPKTGYPSQVSGLPADHWCEEGQLWGTPVYNWSEQPEATADWWELRIRANLIRFGAIRIDHFRAFADFWAIPREHALKECNGLVGEWMDGPGWSFFQKRLFEKYADLDPQDIMVEDLGENTPGLLALREVMLVPRMEVFQFSVWDVANATPEDTKKGWLFGSSDPNVIAFVGTHDNPPLNLWKTEGGNRDIVAGLVGNALADLPMASRLMMETIVEETTPGTLILTLADILCLGKEGLINVPGRNDDRLWRWKVTKSHWKLLFDERTRGYMAYLARLAKKSCSIPPRGLGPYLSAP